MPRDFFTDFVKVAQDEGRHFTLLSARLEELGSFYGALPAHDGLWDSAMATSNDLLARLAIEHCVHEVSVFFIAGLWKNVMLIYGYLVLGILVAEYTERSELLKTCTWLDGIMYVIAPLNYSQLLLKLT